MPQMAPMYWLILFLYFSALFIIYAINLYFFDSPKSLACNMATSKLSPSLAWTW